MSFLSQLWQIVKNQWLELKPNLLLHSSQDQSAIIDLSGKLCILYKFVSLTFRTSKGHFHLESETVLSIFNTSRWYFVSCLLPSPFSASFPFYFISLLWFQPPSASPNSTKTIFRPMWLIRLIFPFQ